MHINYLILIFLLLFSLVKQNSCYGSSIQQKETVWNKPVAFEQNNIYTIKAQEQITIFKNQNIQKNALKGISNNEVIFDLEYMLKNPNSTNLNYSGYYCSVVVVLNWLLNNRPDIYVKSVLELVSNGEYYPDGKKGIKLPKRLLKDNYSSRDSTNKIEFLTPSGISDYILGVSLLNSQKHIQKVGLLWKNATYDKDCIGSFIYGNSAPWEIDNYFKKLGLQITEKKYYTPCRSSNKTIARLEDAVLNGNMPILFENHLITTTRTRNILYRAIGVHYLTLHEFNIDKETNLINMTYWEYGKTNNKREVHKKHSPYAAKNISIAIRRSEKYNKFVIEGKMKKIDTKTFLKGLKGYWIIKIE